MTTIHGYGRDSNRINLAHIYLQARVKCSQSVRVKMWINKIFEKIKKVLAHIRNLLYISTRDAGVVQRLERVLAKD